VTHASRSARRPAASSSIPVADVTAAFASVFVALTLALAGVYATAPAARPWLASELGLVSWFTRGAFVGAIATFLVASCCFLAATPAIGSLGGGEVVAFAARLSAMTGATVLVAAALAAGDHRRTVAGWRNRMRRWLEDSSRPHP
jgi:hypothetical protein